MTKRINSIADLIPDDRNANKGTERGNAFIERSLRQYGAGRSILIDKNGKIIAGNKTIENAAVAGLDGLVVVQTDGTKIVAVQRTDLDMDADPRARELALADNRAGDLNLAWDGPVLAELGQEIDLAPFFSTEELAEIVGEQAGSGTGADDAPDAQIDKAEELRDKWQTAKGQIWEIASDTLNGKAHRLMCGSSADGAAVGALMGNEVAMLMVTDPPYGVQAIGGTRDPRDVKNYQSGGAIENDELTGEKLKQFLVSVFDVWKSHIETGSAWYCFYADTETIPVLSALESLGGARHILVWVKEQFVFGRCDYHYRHEPIAYGWMPGAGHKWLGSHDQSTVWEVRRDNVEKKLHPTVKPVELFIKPFENHTVRGDLVCEPFVGSGSQLCAAELSGRLCYGMEIEPKYVAVALQRMADMGLTPKLVEECKSVAVAE